MDCNEKYDVEKRMWNDSVHILSDRPELAFAWAAYFAEHSNIYVNGKGRIAKIHIATKRFRSWSLFFFARM